MAESVPNCIRFELPEPTDLPAAQSPFGLNLQMELRNWSFDDMRAALRVCRRMGIRWSREEIHWAHVMPERGRFVWDRIDRAIDLSVEHGVEVMGLFAYWDGPWNPKEGPVVRWTDAYNAGGIRDYCDLVRASVRRYKDRVHYWQIWNEPNGRVDEQTGREILRGFWKGTPRQYADLLKAAYETCKEEDPDCTVVGFNMALADLQWLDQMGRWGMMDCADVISFHPYRCLQAPEDHADALAVHCFDDQHPAHWASAVDEARAVRELVAKYAGREKPVWVTEMSWSAAANAWGLQELDVAKYLPREYLLLLGPGGVKKVFWYDLRTYNVGLARQDFSPRYLSCAMATLSRAIEGREYARSYEIGPGNYALLWQGQSDDVLALWTANPTPQFARVKLRAGSDWQLHDLFGQPHVKGDGDAKDPLEIPISGLVRYLAVPRGAVEHVRPIRQYVYELPRDFGPGPVPDDPHGTKGSGAQPE